MTLNSSQVGTEWVNKTQNQNSCTVSEISTIVIVVFITLYYIVIIIVIVIFVFTVITR